MRAVDKRRMCPNCRAFISADDKVCPYCDTPIGPRAIERRNPGTIAGLIPANQFATGIILLINIGLYLATIALTNKLTHGGISFDPYGPVLVAFGGKQGFFIFRLGEWWRLISAGYLHGGLLHIFMNSWALYQVGGLVEELYGVSRYFVFYTAATIAGFALSLFWSPGLSVGASAGIFGLIGVMIAFGMQHRTAHGEAIRSHFTQWAIYSVVIGLLPSGITGFRVDNAAHLGGAVVGFLLAYLTGAPRLAPSWRDSAWKIAAGICLALTAISLLLVVLHFDRSLAIALRLR